MQEGKKKNGKHPFSFACWWLAMAKDSKSKKMNPLFPPGIEPGTLRV